ncbi:hypothetical protein BH23PLA1_BH23PLA1_23060 [soil metagenome]
MVSTDAAERFLRAPFLTDLDADSRQALLGVLKEQRNGAGEVLLVQDQPNDRLFFLIEGKVVIERTYPDGHVEALLDLAAPTAFGETSYFQRKPQIVSVRTASDVWLLTLDRQDHERLRQQDPRASEQLATAAIRVLAEHFDLIDQRVSEFLNQQPDEQPKANEWARFRARLFGESKL